MMVGPWIRWWVVVGVCWAKIWELGELGGAGRGFCLVDLGSACTIIRLFFGPVSASPPDSCSLVERERRIIRRIWD
jgi:hypothetical protein